MKRVFQIALLGSLLWLTCCLPAQAIYIQYHVGDNDQTYLVDVFLLNPSSITYDFTVGGSDLFLTHLGIHDGGATGLDQNYDISMWNAAGVEIAGAIVPEGTAGIETANSWYTALFAPVRLTAGETYVIGTRYPTPSDDGVTTWDPSGNPHFSAIGANHGIYETDSLEFPSEFNGSGPLLGPTFGYSVVPEPSSYALMLCGLAVLAFTKRRQRVLKATDCWRPKGHAE